MLHRKYLECLKCGAVELGKDAGRFGRPCEKRSFACGQGGKEYPTFFNYRGADKGR